MDNQEKERLAQVTARMLQSFHHTEEIMLKVLPTMMQCDDERELFSILGTIVDAYADTHNISEERIREMYGFLLEAREAIYRKEKG